MLRPSKLFKSLRKGFKLQKKREREKYSKILTVNCKSREGMVRCHQDIAGGQSQLRLSEVISDNVICTAG